MYGSNIIKNYILLCLLLFGNSIIAQRRKPVKIATPEKIELCCNYNNAGYEYSSMAQWKDKILLIPQFPSGKKKDDLKRNNDAINILAIDSSDIAARAGTVTKVTNITKLRISNFNKLIYSGYEGIEGCVVIGDTIFFAIETDESQSFCYVVKGIIDTVNFTINLGKKIYLEKPAGYKKNDNAGFESIAYLQKKNRLIVFFERNKAAADCAYLIDTGLTTVQPVYLNKPLLFRLTDIAAYKGDTLIGINHHFSGDAKEFNFYIGADSIAATQQLYGRNPRQSSFTSIVKIYFLPNGQLSWHNVKFISFLPDNWEGIYPYQDGALMIIDGRPPNNPCGFFYFPFVKRD